MADRRYRVGIDIGGTFTDFALYEESTSSLQIYKSLTTPADPSKGAVEGLKALLELAQISFSELSEIVHGTTLVTNALIEGKGAATALLTTRGFRDVLEVGREQRYDVYDLFLQYPVPLVPRKFRREITERILANGEVLTPIDLDQTRATVHALIRDGIKSVAVCFMHSYRNPEHERAVGRLLAEEFPELSVSLSSEVAAEVREYERVSTTTANAFVQPLMARYLRALEDQLAANGFGGRLSLVLSSGALVSPQVARSFPIRLLESGPAGGVIAAALVAKKLQRPDLISFDMGGTTAKTALVQGYKTEIAPMMEVARVQRFKKGSGIPVRAPVVEMIEIGAGGGSIAHLDEVGLLKVGPESASSDPGPACYGLGGTKPTVTDANLTLGYLDSKFFLGGRMALQPQLAREALRKLGEPLGLDAVATAWGIYNIVCENMAAAARAHIVEKGRDPRSFSMIAFGGAGPAHAAKVARIIGVKEVLIPPASGATSAVGFLAVPAGFETVRSGVVTLQPGMDVAPINELLNEIELETRARLDDANVRAGTEAVTRSVDLRIKGQLHEISVPLPDGSLNDTSVQEIRASFDRIYESLYRSVPPDAVVETLTWRVRVSRPAADIELQPRRAIEQGSTAVKGKRQAFFGDGLVEATVYDRYALRPGTRIVGPAIIEEYESTTIVPPGDRVEVDAEHNLRLTLGEALQVALPAAAKQDVRVARAGIEADPIALEIMWSRLVNVVDECWDAIVRTSFSLILSDAQDFSVALFDRDGRILAQSARAQPLFNMCLPLAIQSMLERFPEQDLRPGDVLITNDPWLGSGHLYDCVIVAPVFHEGRLVAHVGAIGHVSDIGGTRNSDLAFELYDEGLQIPPMKLYRAGEPNQDLLSLLRENVRDAREVVSDLHALVSATSLGAQRLRDFLTEYRLDDLANLARIFHERSEAAMRAAIRAVPDGVYASEISARLGGELQTVPIKIIVEQDEMTIDLSGAPPQAVKGGLNCTLNYTSGHTLYPFKCLLTPTVRCNSGCFRPFKLRIPEGTLLNCRKPASVRSRQVTGWLLGPNVLAALDAVMPDSVRAFSGYAAMTTFYGTNSQGDGFIGHVFIGGGQGGSARDDGKNGLLFPIGSANTSIELFEIRTGLLVAEKQLLQDSGGAGRQRGGLGQVIRIVKLQDAGHPVQYTPYINGVDLSLPGMRGGAPGKPVQATAVEVGGNQSRNQNLVNFDVLREHGDAFEMRTAGGHGYGDPLARDIDLIRRDLEGEYISRACAEAHYGCVFDDDGRLDITRTLQRRKQPPSAVTGASSSAPAKETTNA